jgi:hypothetical protein
MIGKDRHGLLACLLACLLVVLMHTGYGLSLRPTKQSEAIGSEMEDPGKILTPTLGVYLSQLAAGHIQWMRHFQPLLISYVEHFLTDLPI